MKKISIITAILTLVLSSCKTTSTTITQVAPVPPTPVELSPVETNILKRKVAIARFSNETLYGKGAFYNKENDPLANKATDILSAKLAQSNKFLLLEARNEDLENYGFDPGELMGVDYIIVGSISEFGRKDETDSKVFSRTREQTAVATVNIRLVDVKTGQVIYGEEGSGSSKSANKSSLGLGSTASYDTSINDQAIAAAISELINNIINKLTDSPWKSYILSLEADNSVLIAGGESQGIQVGDVFLVEANGKTVKNPQTGASIQLPGKEIAQIQVDQVLAGSTPDQEISICRISQGSLQNTNLNNTTVYEKN